MPLTPPPPPLTDRQLSDAIARGAKSMREIDPALAKWIDGQAKRAAVLHVLIAFGAAMFVLMLSLMIAMWGAE